MTIPIASDASASSIIETATFGGGCFWCTEAFFKTVKGVISTSVGYTGGSIVNPSYEKVCMGTTGHAEVLQITFDPAQTNYEQLVYFHLTTHDPTTLNRQGNDTGTQYRSCIFTHTDNQAATAKEVIKRFELEQSIKCVTQISPLEVFYPAEIDHQNYFENNPNAPYCAAVIAPKVKKLLSAN